MENRNTRLAGLTSVPLLCLVCATACGGSSGPALWYAGTVLCSFAGGQLEKGSQDNPSIQVASSAVQSFSDVAVDENGNVWAVGPGSDDVLRFPARALQRSGSADPDLVLRSAALRAPGNLAFDSNGDLWVANRRSDAGNYGSVLRFDNPRALSGAQQVAPALSLVTPALSDFFLLGAMAFDPSGNLWVTSFAGLLRFDQPQMRSGLASLAADAVIEKRGYPNNVYFYAIAFDAAGDLWVSAAEGALENSLMKFTAPGALTSRSSPARAVVIAGSQQGEILPAGGLAFDGDGNLWTANNETISMYSRPAGLSGNVDPPPARSLPVFNKAVPSLNGHLVFFPHPTLRR